ncbi:MAG: hypothetical protein M0R46_10695, partial [Candidatus Muirbacterium halophilum]|nr:hypothetical protein [Candidatus Muirbacterium halophilum]
NCKKLNIVIWLSKEADDEFMRISYGDKGNKSNKFELEFAEFKVEHEFSDYILEIERSFFGIPLIDGVELLDEYLIVDGVFPGVDTPEVYIDDTSELVIMWDTGEILASNNKKDGKKVIVRQGLFECFTNINEELGEQGKTGDRETGLGNEENESEIIEESTEEVKLDSGSETHRNDRDSEEIEIEASRKTVDRETGLGNEENESEIIEESTEEVKLDSGSEAYRNDSEDQVLLDNEELKIKNEKLEEQEVGIREEGESDEKQISNDVDLLIEHSKLDIENLGECKIEKDETNEIELDSGSEAYRNDSEDQVLLDNEELIIKNEELIIKNEELGEQEIEENETIEIELDSGLETYRNDTEEQVLNYSEELKEYFGEDSFEVVYLRDKVIDIADINTFIVIDDGYYFVKVYDVETKIYTIFEVLFNKELEFEKNTVLFIKNEIEELKVRLIADKYLELLYKISDKLYKKIVKKAVRSERVNVENLK